MDQGEREDMKRQNMLTCQDTSFANEELLDPSTKTKIQFDIYIPRYPRNNEKQKKVQKVYL